MKRLEGLAGRRWLDPLADILSRADGCWFADQTGVEGCLPAGSASLVVAKPHITITFILIGGDPVTVPQVETAVQEKVWDVRALQWLEYTAIWSGDLGGCMTA